MVQLMYLVDAAALDRSDPPDHLRLFVTSFRTPASGAIHRGRDNR
jgi:hypothetical protein